jgi:hypothetical protein
MKKILFLVACFFIFPLTSFATYDFYYDRTCPEKYVDAYKNAFDNINVSYSFIGYNTTNKKSYYKINVTNIHPNVSVSVKGYERTNVTETEYKITYDPDLVILYKANYKGCSIYALNKEVKLPKYNPFYNREECNGLTSFPVCKRWTDETPINEKDFKNKIEEAKKQQAKKTPVENTKVKRVRRWYTYITDIFVKYWWAVILVVVLISGIFYSIRLKNKKNEYNFKL